MIEVNDIEKGKCYVVAKRNDMILFGTFYDISRRGKTLGGEETFEVLVDGFVITRTNDMPQLRETRNAVERFTIWQHSFIAEIDKQTVDKVGKLYSDYVDYNGEVLDNVMRIFADCDNQAVTCNYFKDNASDKVKAEYPHAGLDFKFFDTVREGKDAYEKMDTLVPGKHYVLDTIGMVYVGELVKVEDGYVHMNGWNFYSNQSEDDHYLILFRINSSPNLKRFDTYVTEMSEEDYEKFDQYAKDWVARRDAMFKQIEIDDQDLLETTARLVARKDPDILDRSYFRYKMNDVKREIKELGHDFGFFNSLKEAYGDITTQPQEGGYYAFVSNKFGDLVTMTVGKLRIFRDTVRRYFGRNNEEGRSYQYVIDGFILSPGQAEWAVTTKTKRQWEDDRFLTIVELTEEKYEEIKRKIVGTIAEHRELLDTIKPMQERIKNMKNETTVEIMDMVMRLAADKNPAFRATDHFRQIASREVLNEYPEIGHDFGFFDVVRESSIIRFKDFK